MKSGLSKGDEIAFFSNEIIDTAGQEPIAMGVIDEVTPFDCDVVLEKKSAVDLEDARAFLRNQSFGTFVLNLEINLDSSKEEEELSAGLAKHSFLKISNENPDLFLDKNSGFAGNTSYELLSHDETSLAKFESDERLVDKLVKIAAQYAQAQFLKSLDINSPVIKPIAKILRKNLTGDFEEIENGIIKEGEIVKIRFENEGEIGFYFSVIDITPDYKSSVIIPNQQPAIDYFLRPGSNYFSEEFKVSAPFGAEVLKIIATTEPLNLNRSVNLRGNSQLDNPLEILFAKTFFPNELLRSASPPVYPGESAVSSLFFEIQPLQN